MKSKKLESEWHRTDRLDSVTSRDHVLAEIKRLRIAVADMQHAAGAARHMTGMANGSLDRMHNDAKQALETGAIVSYARPFTRHGVGALDKDEWAPNLDDERRLHHALIELRHKRYAHTDKTGLRGIEDVFGDGQFSHSWVELKDEAWPRIETLAAAQAQRMRDLANRLEGVLSELPKS
jgi:hypothetical protein